MLRSEMLDKDEGHSGIGGKVLQEPRKCLQSSSGRTYGDDRERRRRLRIIGAIPAQVNR